MLPLESQCAHTVEPEPEESQSGLGADTQSETTAELDNFIAQAKSDLAPELHLDFSTIEGIQPQGDLPVEPLSAIPRPGRGWQPQDNHVALTPNGGRRLVNQTSTRLYHFPGDEALWAINETFLISIDWIPRFSRHNQTASEETHSVRTMTRLTVTNGTEASREIGLSGSFNGLGISFGATFSSRETVQEHERTSNYTIPPGQSLFVHQRRFTFVNRIWFLLDAWNELWVVGSRGGYTPTEANIRAAIDSEE
jgi:hypothetical protein